MGKMLPKVLPGMVRQADLMRSKMPLQVVECFRNYQEVTAHSHENFVSYLPIDTHTQGQI